MQVRRYISVAAVLGLVAAAVGCARDDELADGSWRLNEVRRAFRCRRGHHLESFSAEGCP